MMKSFPKESRKNLLIYISVLFIITLILRIILINYYTPDYGGIDMNVIYGIQRIILGEPLYQNPSLPSYAIIQYTPLYYYTVAGFAKMIGISAFDVQSVYALTRFIALVFNLFTVGVIALIIRQWGFSWMRSLVFAFPIVMMLTTHYYLRGDSMHLFFFSATLYSLVRYINKKDLTALIVAAIFTGCCVITKQSGILILGIAGFYLLFIERKFFATIIYTLFSLLAAFIVLKLCIADNWPGFYQNAYLGLKNGIGLDFLYTIFISQFYYDLIPCYFLGGLLVYVAFKSATDKQFKLIATGAVLSFLFAVITGLKIGSSNNYFTEFLVFIIIAVPWLLQNNFSEKKLFRIKNIDVSIKRYALIALIILISSKTLGFFTSMYIERRITSKEQNYNREKKLFAYFKQTLHLQQNEHVYFNERGFLDNIFIENSVMPFKDVVGQVYAANPATYDYAAFISGMNTGAVKYIVTSEKEDDINKFHKEIPFILFDVTRFKRLAEVEGFVIYQYLKP